MIKHMRKSALFAAVASVALLGACGKSDGPGESAGAAVAEAEAALSKITLREGNPANADAALSAMSLADSGSGLLTFSGKDVDGAKATYDNVSFVIPDAEGASIDFGKVEFEGLDMSDAGANFSRLTLSDISITPPPEDAGEGSLTVSKIELLNPSPELAAWVASLGDAAGPAPFPSVETISFDAATLSGFDFKVNEEDEDVTGKLGDITILGYNGDKIDLAKIAGVDFDIYSAYDDTRVKFGLGELSIAGAKKPIIDAFMAGLESGADEEALAEAITTTMYSDIMDPGFDGFLAKDISFDGEGVTFALPSLEAAVTRDSAGNPTKYVTKPYKMTLAADANAGEWGAQLAGGLGMLGYEKVEITGESVAEFDVAKDQVTYKKNTFAMKDGFELDFTGTFGGLTEYGQAMKEAASDPNYYEGDPTAMMEAMTALQINDMKIVIKDDSIVDRLLNLAATQQGMDPEELRNQIVAMSAMAPMMAAQSGIDPELVSELTNAVVGFIQKPGTLTIALDPAQPLKLDSFSAPEQVTKAALGFSASNK